jgi:phage tail-like protein
MKSVTRARATPHLLGNRLDLTWQNPPASDFDGGTMLAGIILLRFERSFPLLDDDGKIIYGDLVYGDEAPGGQILPGPVITAFSDEGLAPLTTYYYTIYAVDNAATPGYYADDDSRAAGFTTRHYNLAERLYGLLPAVHQRYDTLTAAELAQLSPATLAALQALPPELRGRGPLRRFFQAMGASVDLMRSLAEGLRRLHDVDITPPEYLLPLSQWVGWEADHTRPVFARRNEIKFAPHVYRTVGTAPNLRALVNRYTGWFAQVAEFAQHITRSNTLPQFNVFAIVEDATGWRGTDDAASALGFGVGNNSSAGVGNVPATLVSSLAEPFVLRPGMEVAITADDRIPVVVRMQPGDFADIAAATAREVAAALNRELSEVSVEARIDGRIVLTSHTLGLASSLRVEQYSVSLVTLEGAPRGRLAACADNTPNIAARTRLFYESSDPAAEATAWSAVQALSGTPFPKGLLPEQQGSTNGGQPAAANNSPCAFPSAEVLPLAERSSFASTIFMPSVPRGRVRYKTFRNGAWGESFALLPATDVARGDPAAVEVRMLDGSRRILVAWIDNPNTETAQPRFMLGTPRTPQPARLMGRRSGPFNITPGTHLLLRGIWAEAETFRFADSDFANPQSVTAAQLAAVLNARMTRVHAVPQANQTIVFETLAVGGDQRLEIDLSYSSAASALGFESANAVAVGDWGDEIDWSPPREVTAAGPGRHADLQMVVDGAGTAWLFWAMLVGANWNIVSSQWNGAVWSPLQTLASGTGGNREPFAVMDATNRIWLFWSRRQDVGTKEDIWTLQRRVFDPGPSMWDAEASITTPPVGGRATDREPGAVRLASGDLRVYFRSDRDGGKSLWAVTVTPATNAISPLAPITAGPEADQWPTPVAVAANALWLLYRSDRSVPLFELATRPLSASHDRVNLPPPARQSLPGPLLSSRMADTGTLRRFAGATTVTLKDAARIGRRRLWDDLLAYTPQKPLGEPREFLAKDDLYTRGTVGLYLSQLIPDSALSAQMIERLGRVLERFLPINVRVVVILAPRVDIEFVYRPGADIGESFSDDYPFIEYYSGLGEDAAAPLPKMDIIFLLSNTPGHVSANPADLTTLRRRTYFPPLV